MAATLAGNFTILGSIANIIAVQRARQHGHRHRLLACEVGAPVTLATILLGVVMLT